MIFSSPSSPETLRLEEQQCSQLLELRSNPAEALRPSGESLETDVTLSLNSKSCLLDKLVFPYILFLWLIRFISFCSGTTCCLLARVTFWPVTRDVPFSWAPSGSPTSGSTKLDRNSAENVDATKTPGDEAEVRDREARITQIQRMTLEHTHQKNPLLLARRKINQLCVRLVYDLTSLTIVTIQWQSPDNPPS